MPSHTLRRRRSPELQANRKREPSREAAIAAQLRALIPGSTDPAWLEKMAREVESKAHQRYALWSPRRTGNRERNICVTFLGGSVGGMGPVTANALARLSALQGPEFDAVFANLQVAVQTAAVHQFSAYSQNGTSGPLRRYAKLMLPTSKMFLEYAHRLAASR